MRLEVSKKHLGNFISGLCHSEKSFLPSWWREASGCGRTSRHYSWPPEARNWVGRYKGQADGGITTREQERHRTHSVGNQAAGVKHRWPFSCAFSVGQVISRGALLWACVPFQSTKKYLCEADRFLNAFFCRQHRQKAVRGRFHRPRSRWSKRTHYCTGLQKPADCHANAGVGRCCTVQPRNHTAEGTVCFASFSLT